MELTTALENVKGVGAKTAEQFEAAGLRTVGDLIYFYPYKYDDFSETLNIRDISPGKVTLKVRIEDLQTKPLRMAAAKLQPYGSISRIAPTSCAKPKAHGLSQVSSACRGRNTSW